jgi:hypothetical protein
LLRRQKRRQNIGKRLLPLIPASNFPAAVLYNTIPLGFNGKTGTQTLSAPSQRKRKIEALPVQDIENQVIQIVAWGGHDLI